MKVSEILELVRSEFTGNEWTFCITHNESLFICNRLEGKRSSMPDHTNVIVEAKKVVLDAIRPHWTLHQYLSKAGLISAEKLIRFHQFFDIPGNPEIYHKLRNQFLLDLIAAQRLKEQQNETV